MKLTTCLYLVLGVRMFGALSAFTMLLNDMVPKCMDNCIFQHTINGSKGFFSFSFYFDC